jgi:hypothetical protein
VPAHLTHLARDQRVRVTQSLGIDADEFVSH